MFAGWDVGYRAEIKVPKNESWGTSGAARRSVACDIITQTLRHEFLSGKAEYPAMKKVAVLSASMQDLQGASRKVHARVNLRVVSKASEDVGEGHSINL